MKAYYELTTDGWFLWWNGVDAWTISNVLGVDGAAYWGHSEDDIEGLYIPLGTATGNATIAVIV